MTPLDRTLRQRGISDKAFCGGVLGLYPDARNARRVGEWRSGLRTPSKRVRRIIEDKLGAERGSLWPERERVA